MPVSVTWMTAAPSAAPSRTSTRPPDGVYLTALSRRMTSSRRRDSGSPGTTTGAGADTVSDSDRWVAAASK